MESTIENEVLIFARFDCSSVTSERILRLKHTGIDLKDLPKGTRSLLQAELVPKATLAKGNAIANRVREFLLEVTTSTNSGKIISNSKISLAAKKFKGFKAEYEGWKTEVMDGYGSDRQTLLDNLALDPQLQLLPYRDELLKAANRQCPTADELSDKIGCSYGFTSSIEVQDEEVNMLLEEGMCSVREEAIHSLLTGIVKSAAKLFEALSTRDNAQDSQVLSAIKIADKVESFSYLSKEMARIGLELKASLFKLRTGKTIDGHDFMSLREAMRHLAVSENVFGSYKNDKEVLPAYVMAGSSAGKTATQHASQANTTSPTQTPLLSNGSAFDDSVVSKGADLDLFSPVVDEPVAEAEVLVEVAESENLDIGNSVLSGLKSTLSSDEITPEDEKIEAIDVSEVDVTEQKFLNPPGVTNMVVVNDF